MLENTLFWIGFGLPGGQEWWLILFIAVLLFGAKKIPELARGLGRSIGEFKKARDEFEAEIKKSVEELDNAKKNKAESQSSSVVTPEGTVRHDADRG
ncbi:MAG: twin-arginine translocase TatA/TatE family subunit [Methylacidiphilales bacterium]|nr:twin-arginine translocase TatA/TatE family subunit [Candidatus Methylacidiphilales bacterium]MDW8348837.1 twin-arginine translocase TatA/TatE family subunit [Verrucomicrobiae bacterium]